MNNLNKILSFFFLSLLLFQFYLLLNGIGSITHYVQHISLTINLLYFFTFLSRNKTIKWIAILTAIVGLIEVTYHGSYWSNPTIMEFTSPVTEFLYLKGKSLLLRLLLATPLCFYSLFVLGNAIYFFKRKSTAKKNYSVS